MKRQKGSLLQRAMAMLLSAVLVVGMTANAVPMYVFAQENVEGQDEKADTVTDGGNMTGDPVGMPGGNEPGDPTGTPDENGTGDFTGTPDGNEPGDPTGTQDGNEPGDPTDLPDQNLPGQNDTLVEGEEKNPEESTETGTSEEEAKVSIVFQVYGYDADSFGTLELAGEDGTLSCTTETEDKGDYTEITLSATVNGFLTQEEDARWTSHVYVYRNQIQIGDYTVYKGEEQTFGPCSFYAVTFINEGEKYFVDYALDGKAEAVKPSDPVREGYQFDGWVTAEGGDEVFDFTQEIADARTVYASWTAQAAMMSMRAVGRADVNIDNSVKGWIVLNGTPVVVTEGADAGKTKLYHDANGNGEVDAGENLIELQSETGSLDEGYDLSKSIIYGANLSGDYTGDSRIAMTGGNVKQVQAAFAGALHGNFDFHMTGGTVGQIRSAGAEDMVGNVNIVIGGDAAVSEAVYGGAENPDITIDGNINITVEGNASIGSGGGYDGIFIGGQQPDNVITGTSLVTLKSGHIKGSVYADQFSTDFRQKVTVDIQGGTVDGFVQGITSAGSHAPAVEIRAVGGAIQGSVIGVQNAYVEDVSVVVNGGTIGGQLIGVWADKAGSVSIDIASGSAGKVVIGKADKNSSEEKSWKRGSISIHGGTINGMVMLRNGGVAAPTEASELRIEGSPVFGADGRIVLRTGEAVTQIGAVTGSNIPINVENVNQEGTLIVRPAGDSITLDPAVFMLSGTDYDLVFGTAPGTGRNLYLGTKAASHEHQWADAWTDNETHHWHNCEAADCSITENVDKQGYAVHTEDDGTVTTAPTQTTEGVRTYKCSVCSHVMRTETIDKLPPGHIHDYGTAWKSDAANHWRECLGCGDRQNIAQHVEDSGTVTTAPTQTTEGTRTYKCNVCGRIMRTEAIPATGTGGDNTGDNQGGGSGGNNTGSNGSSGSNHTGNGGGIPAGDNTGTDGSSNGSGGGGTADGTISAASRNPGGNGNYDPATAQTRVKSENQGLLRKEVHVKAEDTFDTIIATPLAQLADMLLNETEKQLVAGGVDTRLVLDVKDAADTVSSADKALVEAALNRSLPGFTLGQYLDISLYKLVGMQRTDITRTSDKVIVTMAVPERLRNTDVSKTRVFAVIRVHDGKTDILNDLDTGADTISIATDRFSTYAIVYQDVAKADGTATVGPAAGKASQTRDNEPKTQDNTPIELCATLAMISGLTYLLLYFTDRRHGMSEETKKELVSRMISWAKHGGRIRRLLALVAIFVLLVYYHSIGKQTAVEWKEVYGE